MAKCQEDYSDIIRTLFVIQTIDFMGLLLFLKLFGHYSDKIWAYDWDVLYQASPCGWSPPILPLTAEAYVRENL